MRKALIVQGGWDGHEPVQVSEIFKKILEGEGFEVLRHLFRIWVTFHFH